MLARLLLEPVLRLAEVAERGPRVRGPTGNVAVPEVLRCSAAMACRAVELLRRLLVEPCRLLEPRPDLVRDVVHAPEPTSLVSRLTRMEPSLPVAERPRRPEWMKVRAPSAQTRYFDVKKLIHGADLHTVCEEARCPNIAECWGRGTATFQILGDTCTRACRYCYVHSGKPDGPPDPLEPLRLAQTAATMGLQHVVVTSVDRDDLPDRGARHFAATIRALKRKLPSVSVEVLTPDFLGVEEDALNTVLAAQPEVFNHNIETVRRLHRRMRGAKVSYDKALWLLRRAKEVASYPVLTKSGIIVGLGETNDEVVDTMRDLRANGVDVVTIGQYLQPSSKHTRIDRWVHPDEFRWLREQGEALGFGSVFAGPLVRSSYRADEQRHAAETGRGAVAY
jgi:lipoyl synthase